MTAVAETELALSRASADFDQGAPSDSILAALSPIAEDSPQYAAAQHLRARCAMRLGQFEQARPLLLDAIRRGERSPPIWMHLAAVGAQLGMPDDVLAVLAAILPQVNPRFLQAFSVEVLRAMAFTSPGPAVWKQKVFERFILPLLKIHLDRDALDAAINLEDIVYTGYVRTTETEQHFAECVAQIEPLFTAAGRRFRQDIDLDDPGYSTDVYRVGFFVHNATMLAHIEVLISALRGYRRLDKQPFEPTVYCFEGRSQPMEQALQDVGVRLVMLDRRFPETKSSPWQRLLSLRTLLRENFVHELVWVSLVTKLPLAFSMRMAPVQTWWAMKYRSLSQPDIDGYITGSALSKFSTISGRRWRMTQLGVDDWYDAALEPKAAAIRAEFDGMTILATLARTEKMHDQRYLDALVAILQRNPETVFLWAGREQSATVTRAFDAGGVRARTRFIGWVETKLYAQVADIFLDSFPFPCGFTLFQAMAAGKPVVAYDSFESSQVGLWSFLKPIIEQDETSTAQRDELMSLVGPATRPNIAVVKSPDAYVEQASRLIADPQFRLAAGRAGRLFMEKYFSNPSAMGTSLSNHLVELIEQRFQRTAS